MTHDELLMRLLLLSEDVNRGTLLHHARERHQRRFYAGLPSAHRWILCGMLNYYQCTDVEYARVWADNDTRLCEYRLRNASLLAADMGALSPDNVTELLGQVRQLAASQSSLAVLEPFVNVMTHYQHLNRGEMNAVS